MSNVHSFSRTMLLQFPREFGHLGDTRNVDSIVLGQAAGVEHVSFYSRTELNIFPYNEPWTFTTVSRNFN